MMDNLFKYMKRLCMAFLSLVCYWYYGLAGCVAK